MENPVASPRPVQTFPITQARLIFNFSTCVKEARRGVAPVDKGKANGRGKGENVTLMAGWSSQGLGKVVRRNIHMGMLPDSEKPSCRSV